MIMRLATPFFIALMFFMIAAGAAPTAHATSCISNYQCIGDPNGGSCINGTCGSFTSTGNSIQKRSTGNKSITLINPLGPGASVSSFLLSILNIITTTIGPVIVILMLVFVGFKFVTAQGEPGKITEARQMLLWTVVGALILLGAEVIAIGIEATVKALSVGG